MHIIILNQRENVCCYLKSLSFKLGSFSQVISKIIENKKNGGEQILFEDNIKICIENSDNKNRNIFRNCNW